MNKKEICCILPALLLTCSMAAGSIGGYLLAVVLMIVMLCTVCRKE